MKKLIKNTPSINGSVGVQERVWSADNGHKVKVVTRFITHSQGTVMAKIENYCTTKYECDCGNETQHSGMPKKATLLSHDTWTTPQQRAELDRILKQYDEEDNAKVGA